MTSSTSVCLSDFGCGNLPLVGSSGLEPPTSRLSGARSNHLSYEPIKLFRCISSLSPRFCFARLRSLVSSPSCDVSDFSELPRVRPRRLAAGGDDGIRTHDPLLAGQVLSQLSYTPIILGFLFFLECPPLPLESLFRSLRRVTASISTCFLEFWLRHCRRSLKIEQQASHTSHHVPYLTSRLS